MMAIEGAYDGVATVMANIQNVQAYAAENHCTINADGTVSSNAYNEDEGTKKRALIAAADLETTIKQIIKDADQVDTDLYHAMSDINNDRATDGDKAKDNKVIGVPDHPNKNWTPSQNAAWWNSLTGKQQQHLIDHCPDEIRHLDGLPAAARDQANRNALKGWVDANGDEHEGALEYARGKLKEARDNSASEEEIKQLEEKVADLEAIELQTDNDFREHSGLTPTYLLDFDYDEKYHRTTAIVSSGDPDTASYVSTLVPGIGTNVRGDLGDYIKRNENLRAQTAEAGTDPRDVATISYLGYVAPKNDFGHLYQAADIGYADRAAPDLARFEEGLRASGKANGHSFTNTVIGHSYGSTTAGKAMTQVAEGTVDNFIMCGSPGAGADSIDQYNVPKGHVYESSVPEGDVVQGLGPDDTYGTNPKKLPGITHLSGDTTEAKGYWTFADSLERTKGIEPYLDIDVALNTFSNHMSYFDKDTRAFQDFANIIGGGKQTTDEEWSAIETERGK